MNHSTPGLPVYHQLRNSPKPMSIELVMPSKHLFFCRPLLLLLLPSIFPNIRVFSNESVLRIRWPKFWSFSFNIGHSNEHPGLISFRLGWLDLLTLQGMVKSLLQHHSSRASILRHSAFLMIQLSHYLLSKYQILLNPMLKGGTGQESCDIYAFCNSSLVQYRTLWNWVVVWFPPTPSFLRMLCD